MKNKDSNSGLDLSSNRLVEDLLIRKNPIKLQEENGDKPVDLNIKRIKNAIEKL